MMGFGWSKWGRLLVFHSIGLRGQCLLRALQHCAGRRGLAYGKVPLGPPDGSPSCEWGQLSTACQLAVLTWRRPIYIGGRYLKFSRNISQSPWVVEEERMGDASVQELIAEKVTPAFQADDYKFSAAGREDIDVRMLGDGRPFLLELLNARRVPCREEVAAMAAAVNGTKEGWE